MKFEILNILNSSGLFVAVEMPILINRKDVFNLLGILLPMY